MKSGPINRPRGCGGDRSRAGFTLAEVLAALLFMALVIPVAVEALRVAGEAGSAAARKTGAARVADRILNELVVSGQWQRAGQSGTWLEGAREYTWRLEEEPWELGALRVLTVRVSYPVRGREHEVALSTLVDANATAGATSTNTGSVGLP
jgi:hypothetical protein